MHVACCASAGAAKTIARVNGSKNRMGVDHRRPRVRKCTSTPTAEPSGMGVTEGRLIYQITEGEPTRCFFYLMRCLKSAVVIWRSYSRHYFAMSALGWEPHAVWCCRLPPCWRAGTNVEVTENEHQEDVHRSSGGGGRSSIFANP